MKSIVKKCLSAVAVVAMTVSTVQAKQVILKAELASPIIAAGIKQTTFIKVGLTGFKLDEKADRTPANIAIVLDKSGSMGGSNMRNAKQAARMAVSLLDENDIVSIVSYDDTVNVIVPATKVMDKARIYAAIEKMRANGGTALFAGVSKGAAEVRKFLNKDRINRVILLSDGQANVGPSSPSELGQLGVSLSKDGMTVTTIGLGTGYNEDLMANLAGYSDGNHAFVKNADDLAKVFNYEFGDVLSVVAQDVEVVIQCQEGIRPIRVLGREASILGQSIKTSMSQLYSEQEKYVLIEVEVPAGKVNEQKVLADVQVSYQNMHSKQKNQLSAILQLAYSDSAEEIKHALNKNVVTSATKQLANETSKKALRLRDKGDVIAAQALLKRSASFISGQAALLEGKDRRELEVFSSEVSMDADIIVEEKEWNANRKNFKAKQYKLEKQQSY
ncbi:MAG: VWA domain-containing protein [Cocleimonas sp.]|nr:VWA domain-containing protein [Cocleimonas sp.]